MTCRKCNTNKEISEFPKDKAVSRGYKLTCKQCYSLLDKDRYLKNQESIKNRASTWYSKNKQKAATTKRNRLKANIESHVADLLRSRLNKAIKRNYKRGSAVSDLGCSIEEFKAHLESKFQPGMNWENRGIWHIDHIVPLSSFNLQNREELLKACHYTNLQPLWAKDNWSKGARYGS